MNINQVTPINISNVSEKEIERCKRDPRYFFEKYVRLVTKDGKIIPIKYEQFNKYRKDIFNKISTKYGTK